MRPRKYTTEKIIIKLREAEVLISQGMDAGYTIVAATPDKHSKSLDSITVDDKIALLFGTEENGLSDEALANSDYSVVIPMYGFTESFNVSVACSLILRELTERLRRSNSNWNLSVTEISDIKYSW